MTDNSNNDSKSKNSNVEISLETSERVCAHMNEDHALSVYAMAKRKVSWPSDGALWKISEASLRSVSMQGCVIQVVLCRQDLCQGQRVMYPFQPPLQNSSELRKRLVAIHHEVCRPPWRSIWLGSPLAPTILLGFAGAAYCNLVLGLDRLTEHIESSSRLHSLISTCLGSATTFSHLVQFVFIFTFFAHTLEVLYVAKASRELKFSAATTAAWALQLFAAGFPVLQCFRELVEVDRKCKKARKEKNA